MALIRHNGKLLRAPSGGLAGSLNCCCTDDPPPPPTLCCGETLEIEYEVYDQSNTTLLFEGSYQWPLEGEWTTEPQTREGEGVLSITDGLYKIEQGSRPVVVCTVVSGVRVITMDALIGAYFDNIAYDTQNAFFQINCDQLGVWSAWTQTAGMTRYRIRLLP